MPDWTKYKQPIAQAPAPAPAAVAPVEPEAEVAEDDGPGVGTAIGAGVLGAAALAGASKLKSMPGVLGTIGKGAAYANGIRQQLMLSGFAPLKSVLGNLGTGVEAAVEGRGMGALREILSMRTLKDAGKAMVSPTAQARNPTGASVELPALLSLPGRFMGGMDEATRGALQRAGSTAKEAENAVLQSPLKGDIGDVLESPAARYIHPFRRTPFNQFIEGWRKVKSAHEGNTAARRGLAVYGAAGAAHGAATSDEQYPLTVPMGVAASARYGLPYAAAAIIGRSLAGGKGYGGIESSALPVGEYGFGQALDPKHALDPFLEPAVIRAVERLGR